MESRKRVKRQGRNRDTDVENRCGHSRVGGGCANWEQSSDTYTTMSICMCVSMCHVSLYTYIYTRILLCQYACVSVCAMSLYIRIYIHIYYYVNIHVCQYVPCLSIYVYIYIYTTMCKIESCGKLLYSPGSSARCSVTT